MVALQPACGPHVALACSAYRYSSVGASGGTHVALAFPGTAQQQAHTFTPPAILVDDSTHQDIVEQPNGAGATELRLLLADATREACRLKLEEEIPGFSPATDGHNCDGFTPSSIMLVQTVAPAGQPQIPGAPIQEDDETCFASCLLGDDCFSGSASGGFDDPPDHPFARTVRCECQVEEVGGCGDLSDVPDPTAVPAGGSFVEDYCVPAGVAPGDYCRNEIAGFFASSVRAVSHWTETLLGDPTWAQSCGGGVPPVASHLPADLPLRVTCVPSPAFGDIETDAAEAYTQQNDACEPGCGTTTCESLQLDPVGAGGDCSLAFSSEQPDSQGIRELRPECDCDLLPADCFDDFDPANPVDVPGVCLPEPGISGSGDDGADSGTGDGGGSGSNRLKSAITVLQDWEIVQIEGFTCQELDPVIEDFAPSGNPPPTGGVMPRAANNGTSFVAGLLATCPTPATDPIDLGTFDTTLAELCHAMPLCEFTDDLSLQIRVANNGTTIATGSLTKMGAAVTTTNSHAPLPVGDHQLDLCVEHVASGVELCGTQPIRAAAPLGSGIDAQGNFAGEVGADFVVLSGKPGVIALTLGDDDVTRAALPSGFRFPLYGTTVSGYIYVGSDGGINLADAPIAAGNTSVVSNPGAGAPDLAVYWDDLDPSAGGGVYAWYDGVRYIVSWEDVPHGRDAGTSTGTVSVQAHLYADGRVEYHYADTIVGDAAYDLGSSATIGVRNSTGSEAVEVVYDDATLLTSGVKAVAFASDADGCLADRVIVPPQVSCAPDDLFASLCTPTRATADIPSPSVVSCSNGTAAVGEIVESGKTEANLVPLTTPIPISAGVATIDAGVHRIRWRPVDSNGDQVGPSFTQLLFANPWAHEDCGGSRQRMVMTDDPDALVAASGTGPLALIGRAGDDWLVAAAESDFISDGSGGGVCEGLAGDDFLVGDGGSDVLVGGVGGDGLWGGPGDDLLQGDDGDDVVEGGDGHDIIEGGPGDDMLWGGSGDDLILGGPGDDTITPGSGVDIVDGGLGDDTIRVLAVCELTAGQSLSGGPGSDTLLLPVGVTVADLTAAGVVVGADVETVTSLSTETTDQWRLSCAE